MPTISQLAPVTAAADTDELPVNQAGVTRKVSRSQILAGVQTQIITRSGHILGRSSKSNGAPEDIAIGANLILSEGTLAATSNANPLGSLPAGLVPGATDLVGVVQDGKTVSVQYRQFLSGLPAVPNVDVSNTIVTVPGDSASTLLSEAVGSRISANGGTINGLLTLNSDPTATRHATSKGYVDTAVNTRLPRAGGTMTGTLTLATAPTLAAHAATKGYVDAALTGGLGAVTIAGGTVLGSLVLASDPVVSLEAATKQYVDKRVQRAGDTLTGQLSLVIDPVSGEHATSKQYVDNKIAPALLKSGGTLTGALTLAIDPTLAMHATSKQYVDGRVSRAGDTMIGALVLATDPTLGLQAATKAYVDTTFATALPKTGGTLTGALTLAADPTTITQAATKRYVDQMVSGSLPMSGGTISGSLSVPSVATLSAHVVNKSYVDAALSNTITKNGGTLDGFLVLSKLPTSEQHAVSKQYVDANPGRDRAINVALPPYNAKLDGVTDDTAAFKAAYLDSPENGVIHVPRGTVVLQSPSVWQVSLTKRVKWVVDGTMTADGVALSSCIANGSNPSNIALPGTVIGHSGTSVTVSRGRSQSTDLAVFQASGIFNHDGGSTGVLSTARTDTIIYSTPANFIWGGLDRLVWAGRGTASATAPAQHVARYIQSIRQTVYTASDGTSPPQPELWAACLEYRDATGRPSSVTGGGLTVEMDWVGNGPDDAKNRQIQSLVVAQHDPAGAPVDVSSVIGIYLGAGSKGQAQKVINVGIPFATAVLDTTYATQLTGAAAIRMAAGHSIAFEPSGNTKLAYDSATNSLRWYQGPLSFVVGKGITVGWQNVVTSNVFLGGYLAGNLIFLAGTGAYTVTLPPASTVASGTGFTFSAVGSGSPTIAASTGEYVELGPITLRQHDRYHVVSDGNSTWREIFRTNAVSPRFTSPPVLPSYTVVNLPATVQAGAKAFASNGRKPSELTGAGTGVEVFFDGSRWISVCGGTQVAA